jgi:hypothetical protein
LQKALDEMLSPLGLVYSVEDREVIITSKKDKEAMEKKIEKVPR